MPMPSRTVRYSGSERPAWRMNHTGVCGPARSPRAARRNGAVGQSGVGSGSATVTGQSSQVRRRVRHIGTTPRLAYSGAMVVRHETAPEQRCRGWPRGVPRGRGDACVGASLRPEVVLRGDAGARSASRRTPSALTADVTVDDEDLGTGRIILLHDPAGNDAWDGTFRCVAYARADIDPELVTDPMLADVGWSLADRGARGARRRLRRRLRHASPA